MLDYRYYSRCSSCYSYLKPVFVFFLGGSSVSAMPAFPLLTWRWRMWIWTSVRSVVSAVKIVDQAYRMTFVIVFSCTRQVCQTGRLRSCFWKPRYSRRQKWVQKAQHTFWIYAIFCSLCDSDLVQWQGSYCCDGDEHGPYIREPVDTEWCTTNMRSWRRSTWWPAPIVWCREGTGSISREEVYLRCYLIRATTGIFGARVQ